MGPFPSLALPERKDTQKGNDLEYVLHDLIFRFCSTMNEWWHFSVCFPILHPTFFFFFSYFLSL